MEIYLTLSGFILACLVALHTGSTLSTFGLRDKDYANLKWEDEPVEVFLSLED